MKSFDLLKRKYYLKYGPTVEGNVQVALLKQEILNLLHDLDPLPCKIKILGSLERNTSLRVKRDLDLFLYYTETAISVLEKLESSLLKLWPKVKKIHSGFPYFRLEKHYPVALDLVPCFISSLDEKDKTEIHHLYLNSRLNEELKREIVVFKALLKKNKLYGADSSFKGLSGYCVECLIYKYKKIEDIPPLDCFLDPTDPTRNLFSPLSFQNLQKLNYLLKVKFKRLCRSDHLDLYYMENPPLKLYTTFKKSPYVRGVVFTKKILLLQVQDVYKKISHLPIQNPVWTNNSLLYFNSKETLKKYPVDAFLAAYPFLKKTNFIGHLKTFNHLR